MCDAHSNYTFGEGSFLNIQPVSCTCVKISVSKSEAAKLGISFESFGKDDPETAAFLTYVVAVLRETKLLPLDSSSITVEVYGQQNKSLIILISSHSKEKPPLNMIAAVHTDPADFFDTLPKIMSLLDNKISGGELYAYNDAYALVLLTEASLTFCRKKLSKLRCISFDRIKNAKIREYGKLISDSPLDLFK